MRKAAAPSSSAPSSDSAAAPSPALSRYLNKRNFKQTPEPDAGDAHASGSGPRFVVQKHWASRLHYDFRLELDGVLKSWAVPKGPSFDPRDKRMAVEVEDHPLAYADFEGEIPPKQYGAGKVIVWDKGAWEPLGDAHRGYRDGNLKFELHGHKLRGKWALVRIKGRGEKQTPWLLIKEKDQLARPAEDFSVVDEMPDSVLGRGGSRISNPEFPPGAKQAKLPAHFSPQLATLVDKPPQHVSDWLYEIKFDGYRLLARLDGERVQLFTRNGHDWTERMPVLAAALSARQTAGLPSGWYDGEVVVLGPNGVPDFQALQQSFDTAKTADLVYFLFDLPYVAGHDLRALSQEVRREMLEQVLEASLPAGKDDSQSSGRIRLSQTFEADPADVVQSACRLGLEGVIGKRRDAPYLSRRSPAWIKLKCGRRQEFVIGGYTDPRGARVGLGALLLGVHGNNGRRGQLRYAGSVGTGFDDRTLSELKKKLDALASTEQPFAPSADLPRGAHWVRPELIAEVSFGEWTQSGRIRHPVFHGLRSDKPAREIVREQAAQALDAQAAPARAVKKPAASKAMGKAERSAAPRPSSSEALAASRLPPGLRVSNPERLIDAVSGLHKIDLVRYYALVGPLMLSQLKGRPVALVRAPEGVGGELFFQKHADVRKLPGMRQLDPALYPSHPPMLEIASAEGLASIAQWNVIEVHSQNAVASAFSTPDRMVFDLDPGEGVVWAQIQEAAGLLQSFLQELGLKPFLKTSGGKGLHVVVPLKKQHDWDTVKGFSQAVVAHLARLIPQRFVLKSGGKNRVGKIFIDYLRNGLGATTVAAWSARARPGMGISVPVDWTELASLKSGDHWTVRTVQERLAVGNAPWDSYAKSSVGLARPMQRLGWKPE